MSWRNLFEFSRSERRGIVLLVIAIVAVTIVGRVVNKNIDKKNEQEIIELVKNIQQQQQQLESIGENETDESPTKDSVVIEHEPQKKDHKNSSTSQTVEMDEPLQSTTDINKVSAPYLIKVLNIEPQMAFRIVKYRESLGGFYSMKQLGEVFEISSETLNVLNQKFVITQNTNLTKLSVNSMTAEELKAHPYVSPKLAEQIINFRTKVKNFEKIEDLKKLYFVDDVLYGKLAPYISIN